MRSASRTWTDEDLLPHESAAHELWEEAGDSWVRVPSRERSTVRTIAGVALIVIGAYSGQMTLVFGFSMLIAAAFASPRSALIGPLFGTLAGGALAGAFLYSGIKMISARPAQHRQ